MASLIALAALAALLLGPSPGPRVERILGRVEIGSGEPPIWRVARAGDPLAPGDVVRTGHDGRAELVLAAGSVRLYGDTLLRLPMASAAPGSADAVELDEGSSLFDILRRGRDDFEVRTPEVVVSIKGTRFLVVAEERAEVAVFHGTVGLHLRVAARARAAGARGLRRDRRARTAVRAALDRRARSVEWLVRGRRLRRARPNRRRAGPRRPLP